MLASFIAAGKNWSESGRRVSVRLCQWSVEVSVVSGQWKKEAGLPSVVLVLVIELLPLLDRQIKNVH
jgi:hypothetical protein